jgi:transcriptional regulator with XRE-family HTH domain
VDQVAFGRFVRRAVDQAKNIRGWTVNRLSAETGVSRSTLFRWLAGDCQQFPELANVRSFCAALDIPVSAAFLALGLPDAPRLSDTEPAWPDLERIMRRLGDPSVSESDKATIRAALHAIVDTQAAA